MDELSAKEKDARILVRVQKRLARLKMRYRTWRRVGSVLEVNHFYLNYVMKGSIPTSTTVRRALGFPRVMPSERKPRKPRDLPRLGDDGWEEVYLRKLK